jgi:hypothetical protein
MIKFFRKIRQRLLTENNFSKYLIYAIGEIVLVVIGILIALQINNANETRKDKNIERALLESIYANLIQDDSLITRSLTRYDLTLRNVERFFKVTPIPDDSLAYICTRATGHARFIPNTMAFDRGLSSGKFDLIRNNDLAETIQFLYAFTYKSNDETITSLDYIMKEIKEKTFEYQAMEISSTTRKDFYDKSYVLPFNIENLKKRNEDSELRGLLKHMHIAVSEATLFYQKMLEENRTLRVEISTYLKTLKV